MVNDLNAPLPASPERPPDEEQSTVDSDDVLPLYDLTLFVSGASGLAARAIANVRALCEVHLPGRYHLSVVDVHDDLPALAVNGVLATPTLFKNLPLPVRKVVGDLARVDKVLLALDLPDETEAGGEEPPHAPT